MPDSAISAAESDPPDGGPFKVMVPLANPRTSTHLLKLASIVATANDGIVEAVHIVQMPDQTPLYAGAEHAERIDAESTKLLESAVAEADTIGVPVATRTVVSHRSFEEIFDAADTFDADCVVMGWGDQPFWTVGRVESTVDELTRDLPCDFFVLDDAGFETDRVLVPTAGGEDSELSAALARYLSDQRDATVELLYVVDSEVERTTGASFLGNWAQEHDLGDAELTIDVSGDVEGAVARHSEDATMVVVGATGRGLLSRIVRGSLVHGIVEAVDCSVVLAEKAHPRSLRQRLFGRGSDADEE